MQILKSSEKRWLEELKKQHITSYILTKLGLLRADTINDTPKLINLIDYCNTYNTEAILVLLVAEDAFDGVNWKFLFVILQKFGFWG